MPIYKQKGFKNGKQRYKVQINYKDNFGNNRQTSRIAYGLTEAKELERDLASSLKNSPITSRLTLNDLFTEYEKAARYELKEATLKKNCDVMQHHVLPFLGEQPLSNLTAPVLQSWKNYIEEKTIIKFTRDTQKKLSIRSKQNIFTVFRLVLNWGVRMDYLASNNLNKVGNFKSSTSLEKKEMLYYTAEEFKKFITVAYDHAKSSDSLKEWDYFVFFAIAFYTGLRKGEIHALKWSDITINHLKVSRSVNQKLPGKDIESAPKNSSSIRTLQMPAPLIDILKEHKNRWKQHNDFNNNFYVCGGTRSLRDTTIEKKNLQFSQEAGVKKIRIHDFRHSHVSLLANEGINIQEIARRLGHSKIEMTWNTYSHLYPREEERAVDILNKINIC